MKSFINFKTSIFLTTCLLLIACDLAPDIPCEDQSDCTPPMECFRKRCFPSDWIKKVKEAEAAQGNCGFCIPGKDQCIDLQANAQHCGKCGNKCAQNSICRDGHCLCGDGLFLCPDGCADLNSSSKNCGDCGFACFKNEYCFASRCIPIKCENQKPPLITCDGDCVALQQNPLHCGKCGNACRADQVCLKGTCVCSPNQKSCDERCVDTKVDFRHCGGCGKSCQKGEVCSNGKCLKACPASQPNICFGGCYDLRTSAKHCRKCGNRCFPGFTCFNGNCTCSGEERACGIGDGTRRKCTDVRSDWNNCGSCGSTCKRGELCAAGRCVTSCPKVTPTACFGGCYDLNSSIAHCGKCGHKCKKGFQCIDGICSKESPSEEPNAEHSPRETLTEVLSEHIEVKQEPSIENAVKPSENADEQIKKPEIGPISEKINDFSQDAGEFIYEGKPEPTCIKKNEICNGKDDNCDGISDKVHFGLGQECYVGVGECRNKGVRVCSKLGGTKCSANAKPTQAEDCDGKDNDCDGQTDEGLVRDCYSGTQGTKGVGPCRAGKQNCIATKWEKCVGAILPTVENCDGKDNDCNGKIDDGLNQNKSCYTGKTGTENTLPCKKGVYECTQGKWNCKGEIIPQKEVCTHTTDVDCDGKITKQCLWVTQTIPVDQLSRSGAIGMAEDANGNIYIIAKSKERVTIGSTTFGKPNEHYSFVAKLDKTGKIVWALKIEGTLFDGSSFPSTHIITDKQSNVYIAGSFTNSLKVGNLKSIKSKGGVDLFLLKVNTKGSPNWIKQYGSKLDDYIYGLVSDSTGSMYIAGVAGKYTDFGGGNTITQVDFLFLAAFIAKLNTSGSATWLHHYSGVGSFHTLLYSSKGNLYTVGNVHSLVKLKQKSGSFITLKDTGIYILKLDINGNFIWAKVTKENPSSGSTNTSLIKKLSQDSLGNLYLYGSTNKEITLDKKAWLSKSALKNGGKGHILEHIIFKMDSNGNPLWGTSIYAQGKNGSAILTVSDITVSKKNELCIAGYFSTGSAPGHIELIPKRLDKSKGYSDIFIAFINTSTKNITKAYTYGGTLDERLQSLHINSKGEFKIFGDFESANLSLGSQKLKGTGALFKDTKRAIFIWSTTF